MFLLVACQHASGTCQSLFCPVLSLRKVPWKYVELSPNTLPFLTLRFREKDLTPTPNLLRIWPIPPPLGHILSETPWQLPVLVASHCQLPSTAVACHRLHGSQWHRLPPSLLVDCCLTATASVNIARTKEHCKGHTHPLHPKKFHPLLGGLPPIHSTHWRGAQHLMWCHKPCYLVGYFSDYR